MHSFERLSPAAAMADVPARMLVDTTDPDQAAAAVATLFSPHTLSVRGDRHVFRARVGDLPLGDVHVTHFGYGAEVEVVAQPLDCYAVNFILQGSVDTSVGRQRMHLGPGEAVAYSPQVPFQMRCSSDHEMLCLVIPADAVERRAGRLADFEIGDVAFEPYIDRHDAALLRTAVGTALRMASGRTVELPNAVGWELRDSILGGMLLDLRHNQSDAINAAPVAATRLTLDRAIAVMRTNLAAPVSIPHIARLIDVPLRTLQEAFRVHRDSTPLAYYKRLRLEAVREALERIDSSDSTVTHVAVAVGGFFHLGRFSREYCDAFGEYPSDTRHRALARIMLPS